MIISWRIICMTYPQYYYMVTGDLAIGRHGKNSANNLDWKDNGDNDF